MSADKNRVKTLFRCALHLPPTERTAFLGFACRGDAVLRSRLDQLFAASAQADDFLEDALPLPAPTSDQPQGEMQIGPYTLDRRLGEGGMGEVWSAEQHEPIRRTVALKLVKAGMDSAAVLYRFEQERQVLARMNHPNIAHVLEAGQTESGRPYFVMELVNGVPITRYCNARELPLRSRLELFVHVCAAVQHAHQKGVIHRDLKPSNVLVADVDGRPVPKVIDFGIAKAVGEVPADSSATVVGLGVLGTIEYMAPEQAEPGRPDVDTRADVYSLGALLYELLSGRPPLSPEEVRPIAFAEALRRVREEVPPRPSARLAGRSAEPRLAATLRSELDWVVMKALEKDRERRYATASELAADLERYLNDEPVTARPPGRGYRLRKFVHRNRWPVAAAVVVALALIGGAGVATAGWVAATRAEKAADTARADAVEQRGVADERAEAAARESKTTKDVLDYVRRYVFSAGGPVGVYGRRGRDLTLKQAIDEALLSIHKDFGDRPAVEARIRHWIGQSYLAHGEPAHAIEQLRLAARMDEGNPPADPSDAHIVLVHLAMAYMYEGRIPDATTLLTKVTPAAVAQLGPDHRVALLARSALGRAYDLDGRSAEAVEILESVAADYGRVYHPGHPDTRFATSLLALAYSNLGREKDADRLMRSIADDPDDLNALCVAASVHQRAGRPARAVELFRRLLPLCEARFGPRHPSTLETMVALGGSYVESGRAADGIAYLETARARIDDALGPDHSLGLVAGANLADGYLQTGQVARAAELLERVIPRCRDRFGPTHPDTLAAMTNLAMAYNRLGRAREGVQLLEPSIPPATAALGSKHPNVIAAQVALAATLTGSGRPANAIELLKTVDTRDVLSPSHPIAIGVRIQMAKANERLGRTDEAIGIWREVVATRTEAGGPDHADTLIATINLASAYSQAGRPREAIELLEKAVPVCRAALGTKHPDVLNATSALAAAYMKVGRRKEGADLVERLYPDYVEVLGPRHRDTLTAAMNVAAIYRQTDRMERAADLLVELLPVFRKLYGDRHPETLFVQSVLAINYMDIGRADDAVRLLEPVVEVRRKELGPDHARTVIASSNLALALERAGRAEALSALQEVLPRCVVRLGRDDISTLAVKAALASAFVRAGRHTEAATAAKEYLQDASEVHAKDPRALATARADAGRVLLSVRDYSAAEAVLRDCLTAARETDPALGLVPAAETLLGSALVGRGKLGEAEPLLLSGYRGLAGRSTRLREPWLQAADAARRVADLYDALGKADEARSWRVKAAQPPRELAPPPRRVDH